MAVNAKNWQELKKPNGVEKKMGGGDQRRRAVFVAEPLERGFGMTLGNSLRRVLLSSLQGAAVTSIKIDGVLHEFSSLAGVREDVTDIVLNVKQIALKMEGEGPRRLHLSATGPVDVTAGMIQTTGDLEVTNGDLLICHLDEGATHPWRPSPAARSSRADRARRPPGAAARRDHPEPARTPTPHPTAKQLPKREGRGPRVAGGQQQFKKEKKIKRSSPIPHSITLS